MADAADNAMTDERAAPPPARIGVRVDQRRL